MKNIRRIIVVLFLAVLLLTSGIFLLYLTWPGLLGLTGKLPTVSTIKESEIYYEKPHLHDSYVELQASQIYPLDYVIETIKKVDDTEVERNDTSFYAYVVLEDGVMLVELPMSQWGKPFSGSLQGDLRQNSRPNFGTPPDYFLAMHLSEDLNMSTQELMDEVIADFYLDTTVIAGSERVFLVTSIVLPILFLCIILWLVGIAKKEKRFVRFENLSPKKFVEKYRVAPEKRIYMAIAAIYKSYPSKTVECLELIWGQQYFEVVRITNMFKHDWGITDHDSAIDALDSLLKAGHSKDRNFQYLFNKYRSEIQDISNTPNNVKKFYHCLTKIRTFRGKGRGNTRFIDEKYLQKCESVNAWDYVRGFNVASVCYTLGYISEEETWQIMQAFGELIRQEFATWEELSVSFLVGRFIWSENPDQGEFILKMSALFSHYKEFCGGNEKYNLWQKYSLSDLPNIV